MRSRTWLLSGVTGLTVALGGLAAPPPAGAQDATHADVSIGYTCQLPSGEYPVVLRIRADLPAAATVSQPIQATNGTIDATLPAAALADLTAAGATAVGALARLSVTVSQEDSAASATWSGVRTDPVALPEGDLALTLPADAPPVAALGEGELVLAAADLTVTLTGYAADGAVTDPPSVELSCVPAADQDVRIASVVVTSQGAPEATEPPPGAVEVGPRSTTGRAPAPAVEIPEDCEKIDPPPHHPTPQRYCANVTGFVNLAKLNTATLQPPGLVNIAPTQFYRKPENGCVLDGVICQQANIVPNLNGQPRLPEGTSSILPFGFVPATATMQLTQVGISHAHVVADVSLPIEDSSAVITARYTARIYDATVLGVPLDLGPNCRTAVPVEVELHNVGDYKLDAGGALDGFVTIPPFRGCGATEDLDPLVTGLVSGGGNYAKLTQGHICLLVGSMSHCPPEIPDPQR